MVTPSSEHPAAQQVDGEPVDVDRPLDPPRALALGQPPRRAGPRSTVSVLTIAAARMTPQIASTRPT